MGDSVCIKFGTVIVFRNAHALIEEEVVWEATPALTSPEIEVAPGGWTQKRLRQIVRSESVYCQHRASSVARVPRM